MKKRSARIYYVSFLLIILGFVLYLFINTFNDNLLYYRSPTQLVNGNFPDNYIFRIGGMVEEGSLIREKVVLKKYLLMLQILIIRSQLNMMEYYLICLEKVRVLL